MERGNESCKPARHCGAPGPYQAALLGPASDPAEFARWAGCSEFAAAQILRGHRQPTPRILENLAQHLDMPAEALLFEFGMAISAEESDEQLAEPCPLHASGRNLACPFLWQAIALSQVALCPSASLVRAVCAHAEPLCTGFRPHVPYLAAQVRCLSGVDEDSLSADASLVFEREDDEEPEDQ